MKRRIALISDCASPLTGDASRQCQYVGELAKNLALLNYKVDVFTRRDDDSHPEIYHWLENVNVYFIAAGPASAVRKEDLLTLMPQFTSAVLRAFKQKRYDMIHANFFLSGLSAINLKRATEIPFVVTFHTLARSADLRDETQDFPPIRAEIEERIAREADRVVAESAVEERDLMYLYDVAPEKIRRVGNDEWQETARQTAELYEEILKQKPIFSSNVTAALRNFHSNFPQYRTPLRKNSDEQISPTSFS
jgi:D-inositol-3-phosphate glycosyltransferase